MPPSPPDWTAVTMAVTSILALLITGLGLLAVYVQIRKLKEAVWGDTHAKLCEQSLDVLRFIAERPATYAYFYHGKALEAGDPNEVEVLLTCEAVANYLEHIVLQRENLPEGQWTTWRAFVKSTYDSSPALRAFLSRHPVWYAKELQELVGSTPYAPAT